MAQNGRSRSGTGAAIFLIALGIFFLLVNFIHGVSFWWTFFRYWPVILILLGLGCLWDYLWRRRHPDAPKPKPLSGIAMAWILAVLIFSVLLVQSRGRTFGAFNGPARHDTQNVDLLGAKSVSAHIEMPAGQLTMQGGSAQLLQASFDYSEREGKPRIKYDVTNNEGNLEITQNAEHNVHWGGSRNEWNLQFGKNIPLDLFLNMGAGQGDLQLRDVQLSGLQINLGAGQLNVDLTGERKADLPVDIHGGVGQATIRLPKNVGVLVHAHGGIGAIGTAGLEHDGDEYHNDAYGKTPATIRINIEGGIGEIDLRTEG